ncbi:MAG: ABC transporter permease [Thermodesulfobacteriota bacterium]
MRSAGPGTGILSALAWRLGTGFLGSLETLGGMALMLAQGLAWSVRPPWRPRLFLRQMAGIGVHSTLVVLLTGIFAGMVLALQGYYGFKKFGGESLLGATVALSLTRELGPVLTGLMVTARAGSAMAAELGTMRVTEQIDALAVMAVHPVQYLVSPRLVASVVMLPLLTGLVDLIGIGGGYFVGVVLLRINPGIFMSNIREFLVLEDITQGLVKAAVFGGLMGMIGCFHGFFAGEGAEGVGRATTRAVVHTAVAILAMDYILTSLLF